MTVELDYKEKALIYVSLRTSRVFWRTVLKTTDDKHQEMALKEIVSRRNLAKKILKSY